MLFSNNRYIRSLRSAILATAWLLLKHEKRSGLLRGSQIMSGDSDGRASASEDVVVVCCVHSSCHLWFIDERFIHTKRPVSNRGYTRDVRPPAQVGLLLPWFEVSYKSTEICKCNALHVQISLDLWETSDRVLIPLRSWTKTNTIFLHCSNQVSVVNIRTVTESTVETISIIVLRVRLARHLNRHYVCLLSLEHNGAKIG